MKKREPRAWEFFRAHGALWRAVTDPHDMGGKVKRAVRAGMVIWYELRKPGEEPAEAKLDEIQWVRCADVDAVLDAEETMAAHLKERPEPP
jgi:hypothetical protein